MNFYATNIKLLELRFPELLSTLSSLNLAPYEKQSEFLESNTNTLIYNGIQLNSSYDGIHEAKLQATEIPLNASQVFCYGVANGLLIEELLSRVSVQRCFVIILNLPLFAISLNYFDFSGWLNDPRIELMSYQQVGEVYRPFVVLPAELNCVEDDGAMLRDRLCLELDQKFIASKQLTANDEGRQRVLDAKPLVAKDRGVDSIKHPVNQQIIVVAAGPTLSDRLPWLAQQKVSGITIIAVDAAVKALLSVDIVPDFIVAIDKIADTLFSENELNKLINVPLIYFPLLRPEFLETWPGPRYVAYSQSLIFDEIRKELPRLSLFSAGSVLHPAVDLAVQFKAKSIVFVGADFAFPDNKSHVIWRENGVETSWQLPEHIPTAAQATHWVLNGHGQKVPTILNLRGYLRDLERFIEMHPEISFFNTSLLGAKIAGTTLLAEFSDDHK